MPNQMRQGMSPGHVMVAQDGMVPVVRTKSSADGLCWGALLAFPATVKTWKGSERPALTVCSNLWTLPLFWKSFSIFKGRQQRKFFLNIVLCEPWSCFCNNNFSWTLYSLKGSNSTKEWVALICPKAHFKGRVEMLQSVVDWCDFDHSLQATGVSGSSYHPLLRGPFNRLPPAARGIL